PRIWQHERLIEVKPDAFPLPNFPQPRFHRGFIVDQRPDDIKPAVFRDRVKPYFLDPVYRTEKRIALIVDYDAGHFHKAGLLKQPCALNRLSRARPADHGHALVVARQPETRHYAVASFPGVATALGGCTASAP